MVFVVDWTSSFVERPFEKDRHASYRLFAHSAAAEPVMRGKVHVGVVQNLGVPVAAEIIACPIAGSRDGIGRDAAEQERDCRYENSPKAHVGHCLLQNMREE